MHASKKIAAFVFLLFVLLAMGFVPVTFAQTPTSQATPAPSAEPAGRIGDVDEGLHIDIAPYLWFPATNGTVGAGGYQTSVHASAGDVLSNFDFGLMGALKSATTASSSQSISCGPSFRTTKAFRTT
jgi:hypothetical protein